MADAQERTEQATEKRLKEVREKGQLRRSQDLTAWIAVGTTAAMVPSTVQRASDAGRALFASVADAALTPEPATALRILAEGLGALPGVLTPLLTVAAVAVLACAALQGGIRFRKFRPTLAHAAPATAAKRLLGGQAWWNAAKTVLKTAVVGAVLAWAVQAAMPSVLASGSRPVAALVAAAGETVGLLVVLAVAAGIAVAGADVLMVLRANRKQTRMTKREVKDEAKSAEGDPLVKSQRRSRQLALSRSRMIAAVGGSDVVLVNPTHVAVALAYEPGKAAPRVVAKGADHLAARIRAEAEEHGVPLVRDIPLARALHAQCRLGEEIQPEHFAAVAAVLAFVMALKAKGRAGGLHVLPAKRAAARTAQPPPRRALAHPPDAAVVPAVPDQNA
ncbi:EscU/YscU/HrcU family type III secretion system export apparatus switch protein [Sinomonas halotolerans]|uniref:EscU/YscU/HrcU family type III secretion system export apparatus switch protein n=1 Tax=Sinomonas halotolerans TaxID=1644133 RepID=A0ABU9X1L0_9MICC